MEYIYELFNLKYMVYKYISNCNIYIYIQNNFILHKTTK